MAKKDDDLSPGHLEWLVRCRSLNQISSLKLFKILNSHPELHQGGRIADLSISMISVSFSLWRAVFLADSIGGDKESFEDAYQFLGKLILDNAISYPQDRSMREWSFSYYLNNARIRLIGAAAMHPNILERAAFSGMKRSWSLKRQWEHLHFCFDTAIDNLAIALKDH